MRYTLDFEFLEHGSPHGGFITPIAIAIVREDGEEYYAEHATFNWEESGSMNPWLLENVRPHLLGGDYLKHPATIREEMIQFFEEDKRPRFWGYYSDYDWVVFCWHFGRMVDLPNRFPKFCLDIKQLMEMYGVRREEMPEQEGTTHLAIDDARWMMRALLYLEARYKR